MPSFSTTVTGLSAEALSDPASSHLSDLSSDARLEGSSKREFHAPLHVVAMGIVSAISLFFTAKAFSLKVLSGMPVPVADADTFFMMALVFGCLSELFGATYLFRRRKHGTRKKSGAMFVIIVMICMLLPIQFATLSIFVSHGLP